MGDVHKKVLDTRCLVTTPVLTTKFSEIVNKTPDTSSLVTTTVPNTKISQVEKKIPGHAKYINTPEFNKLTAKSFTARLKKVNLVTKADFDNQLISFNRTITSNKTKYLKVQKTLHRS